MPDVAHTEGAATVTAVQEAGPAGDRAAAAPSEVPPDTQPVPRDEPEAQVRAPYDVSPTSCVENCLPYARSSKWDR